ncbi:MAG: hypothetical protein ACRBDI_03235 [Alphaproteobacteria bacterium]
MPPTGNEVISSIAAGHAHEKHVIGKQEFSDTSGKYGSPLPVTTKQDLANVMQDVLNDPATKASMDADGKNAIIMNKSRNIVIILNDAANPNDAGTVYRPSRDGHPNPEQKFSDLEKGLGKGSVRAQNIQEVNAMVDKFAHSDLRATTVANMQRNPEGITTQLDARAQASGLIVPNQNIIDDRLAADTEMRRQNSLNAEEAGKAAKEIEAIDPKEISVSSDGSSASAMTANGDAIEISSNENGTLSVEKESIDTGQKTTIELSEKQTAKLLDKIPGLKGIAGIAITIPLAATVALATGSSPAEAAEIGVDSVLHNTMEAEGVAETTVGLAKDAVAIALPETVEAVNEEKSILETIGAVAEDGAKWAGCAIGGTLAGGSAAVASAPTVVGVPVATVAAGAAGCAGGMYAVDKVIDAGKAAADYFFDDDDPAQDGVVIPLESSGADHEASLQLTTNAQTQADIVPNGVDAKNVSVISADGQEQSLMDRLMNNLGLEKQTPPPVAPPMAPPNMNAP